MTEDWRASLDRGKAVAAVAVDLSKAFDSVCHSLLLAKLTAYGFSGGGGGGITAHGCISMPARGNSFLILSGELSGMWVPRGSAKAALCKLLLNLKVYSTRCYDLPLQSICTSSLRVL